MEFKSKSLATAIKNLAINEILNKLDKATPEQIGFFKRFFHLTIVIILLKKY